MRAVILAGGLGTRLRPYTTVIPKPLVPVGDRPVLEHIVRALGAAGVDRIDLCVGPLGELIRLYLDQLDLASEVEFVFHREREPLGTAGALANVPDLEGTFIVMNGDILTNLSFNALVDFHKERDAALTIAMHRERVGIELGVIEAGGDGLVTGYREKPSLHYDVSMGVYVYDDVALNYLREGACQLPDLVLRLIDAGERVAAYRADEAYWFDIGTIAEHQRAAAEFERAPEKFGVVSTPDLSTGSASGRRRAGRGGTKRPGQAKSALN
jgi:NDP-sugar pyrophosphorylase family protein